MEDRFVEAAAPEFGIETLEAPSPGITLLRLRGELDMAVRDELRAAFAGVCGCRVAVLDVAGVTYADSTALSEIIRFRKALLAAGGAEVRFVGPGSSFEKILQLTDLTKVFPVYASLEEALDISGI